MLSLSLSLSLVSLVALEAALLMGINFAKYAEFRKIYSI